MSFFFFDNIYLINFVDFEFGKMSELDIAACGKAMAPYPTLASLHPFFPPVLSLSLFPFAFFYKIHTSQQGQGIGTHPRPPLRLANCATRTRESNSNDFERQVGIVAKVHYYIYPQT